MGNMAGGGRGVTYIETFLKQAFFWNSKGHISSEQLIPLLRTQIRSLKYLESLFEQLGLVELILF